MDFQQYISKIRKILNYKVFTSIIYGVLAILLFGVLYHNVKPITYDMELFSIAENTIRAPKTVEDEDKTQEEKENAAEEVESVYVMKKEMAQNRVLLLTSIFDFVKDTNHELDQVKEGKKQTKEDPVATIEPRLKLLKTKLTENVSEDITDSISVETLTALLQADISVLENTKETLISNVEQLMNERIREEQLAKMKERFVDQMKTAKFPASVEEAALQLGQYAIVPNDLFDAELTEERKKQAMQDVEPVKILQGQIIVQEGHLIDRETYRQLEMLGLLKSNPTPKPLIGLAIFVVIAIGTLYIHFSRVQETEEKKQNYLLLVSLIFICSLIIMKIIGLMEDVNLYEIAYIFPAAMAPMLIKILINERFALIMTILMAACGSIVFHDGISGTIDVEIAVYILFSGLAGVLFLSGRNERTQILRAGLFISVVNILLVFFLQLIGSGQFTLIEYTYYVLFAVVSGLVSAILTIGLLPFFEAGFGMLSTIRLIELSSPNHPLLKKILTEAPGTYHHSVMVANLAESACEVIGANGLLARVACYYHDVGKTKRPHFFIENQINIENPHDRLPPDTSKDIIIAHVTDGAAELKKHKMPKEIIDIAEQHHGTTLLKFFFFKAKEENENVSEKDFRYPGPKPQTKEAAIISLADSVEAAVRSMNQPTSEEIRALVQNISQDRLVDRQFNECDLTLKEIELVNKTFCEILNGIFHSRIEYPDFKQKKVVNGNATN
ncbi:HD family phosphohydrolase [Lederbergia lenta]|uniref:7TM receptor with intracellular metal dependent phosphohydrolase n=1 Tax=Lederbergia lenta TaxID=1467 RepID=A0A2X4WE79_LEDLE|nr:HD family phosphohydrolase [Lederbergia lenta]MEC2325232.1 HD family phosphohydrolase [Lederbergia lenta]SQI55920.1 7TM receptor with intracellular metal dependent phosphohydrolase [Lederbergia lenta]